MNKEVETIYGEGGGGGCFPAGVMVNTPDGYKPIESIQVGDLVYSFDISSLEPDELNFPGSVTPKKVVQTFTHSFGEVGYTSPLLVITHERGILNVTGNHYILTPSRKSKGADPGFALASALKVGDTLYTEYGEETIITDIQPGSEYDFVYNLEVEDNHTYIADKIRVHNGGGGKSNSPRAAVQAPNTIRTNQIARVLNLVSEGETYGPWNQSDPAQSIFFGGTPLKNSDGSYNYTNITVDYRVGQPSQTVIPGFSAIESENMVNIAVTTSSPVVQTVPSGINAVRVTIEFPNGLQSISSTNGDANGTSVNLRFYTRVTGGTWSLVSSPVINQMSSGPFQVAYRLQNPGSGSWEFRVVRVTADSTSNFLINATRVKSYTSIQEVSLTYNDRALYALTVGADSTNNQIPTMAADWGGILCSIPNNYNPTTRVYSGSWGGTFASTKQWTDNPAWLLLELIRNTRYGLAQFIDTTQIDVFSFYNAAVYCDQLVDDGKGTGTFEPRFTFNAQLMVRDDAWKVLQSIASSFRSMLYIHNGYIRLSQDRPTTPSRILGNSQVVNGIFTYSSADGRTRFTACNATYSDITDNCLPKTITEKASSTDITRYGYTTTEIVSYGATSEGQARRDARWVVDTSLNNTEFIEFQVGPQFADFEPGEVFKVMDTDYAQVTQEGRLVSVTGTTLVLDKPITITTGTWTIDCVAADGSSIETRTITTASGTTSTITINSGITGGVGTAYVIAGAVSPRLFRCISMTEIQPLLYTVRGVQYDPNKYARVESGISIPSMVYWQQPNLTTVNTPTSLVVTPQTTLDPNGVVSNFLLLSWTPPIDGTASSYRISWNKDNGFMERTTSISNSVRINATLGGNYTFFINAINSNNVVSPTLIGNYTLDTTLGTGSGINAPTGMVLSGISSMNISWTAPVSVVGFTLKDYKIELIDFVSGSVFKTVYTTVPYFKYSYSDNVTDGGPRSAITVKVYSRDTLNKTSAALTDTWTALNGSSISGLQVVGGGTTFSTLDLDVAWTATTPSGSDFTNDPSFGYYKVEVFNGASLKRTTQTLTPSFKYSFNDNVADNGQDSPSTSIVIKVTGYTNLGIPTATATTTFTPAAPPTPSGLVVKGIGGTSFNLDDLEVTWTCNDDGGKPYANNSMFKYYQVRVFNGVTVKRVETTTINQYVYDFFKNVADNTTALRTPTIKISAVSIYNVASTAISSSFTNATPAAPSILLTVGYDYFNINAVRQTADIDVVGYEFHVSTSSGFTPSGSSAGVGTCVYRGPNSSFNYTVPIAGTSYYIRVAAYDRFGDTGLSYSAQVSGATVVPTTFTDYIFPGFTFTPNTPSANNISWSAGTAQKTAGSGSPATWSVTSGSATWSSGSLYVYWDEDTTPTTLKTTTNIVTATGSRKRVLAVYKGGTDTSTADGKIIIDGTTNIFPGTISAPSLTTGSAVITNEAQMGAATINSAAIKNLAVGSAQIANLAVTSGKIQDLTIDTLKLKNGSVIGMSSFYANATSTVTITNSASNTVGTSIGSGFSGLGDTLITPSPVGISGPFKGVIMTFVNVTQSSTVPVTLELTLTIDYYDASSTFITTGNTVVTSTLSGMNKSQVMMPVDIENGPGERVVIRGVGYRFYSSANVNNTMHTTVGPFWGYMQVNLR